MGGCGEALAGGCREASRDAGGEESRDGGAGLGMPRTLRRSVMRPMVWSAERQSDTYSEYYVDEQFTLCTLASKWAEMIVKLTVHVRDKDLGDFPYPQPPVVVVRLLCELADGALCAVDHCVRDGGGDKGQRLGWERWRYAHVRRYRVLRTP